MRLSNVRRGGVLPDLASRALEHGHATDTHGGERGCRRTGGNSFAYGLGVEAPRALRRVRYAAVRAGSLRCRRSGGGARPGRQDAARRAVPRAAVPARRSGRCCRRRGGRQQRVHRYLRPIAFTVSNDDLLRYARLSLSLLNGAGSAPAEAWIETYGILGLAASRAAGWIGDTARCEALALELTRPDELHAGVERMTSLATVLLEIVHQHVELADSEWNEAAASHFSLSVPWLDELLSDRSTAHSRIVSSAAQVLRRAELAIGKIHVRERAHLQAHLDHATARLEHARGDPAAAIRSEEHALRLLDHGAESGCNIRILALLGLADHHEALGNFDEAARAARDGVFHALIRADRNEAARGLTTLGRASRRLGHPDEASQYLAHSLVVAHGLSVWNAVMDRWLELGKCMADLGRHQEALTSIALGLRMSGGREDELARIAVGAGLKSTAAEIATAFRRAGELLAASTELSFLMEITGIGRDETNAFIATFRSEPPRLAGGASRNRQV
jgi:tetratricopeptide (TPR) repeat protein